MVSEVLLMPSFAGTSGAGQINQPGNTNAETIKNFKNINNAPMWVNTGKQILRELTSKATGALPNLNSKEVTQWSFLCDTFLQKGIDKTCSPEVKQIIANLDKSLISTKTAQNAVKNIFGVEMQQVGNTGNLLITSGSKAGTVATNALGMTTKGGLLLSAACEYTDLRDAARNGDFCKQTVRSGTKVAVTPFIAGVTAQVCKAIAPPQFKTLGMVAGMFLGSYIGNKATTAATDLVLGKSIKSQIELQAKLQNERTQAKFAEMKYEKALQQA